ncbi:MAG: hypothetical protein COV52_10375 [Gammaproteobacteria bacterium CG11_big_fil_rev_8_21_14_0_20_46_22]|nr:MAG: hypothetical protein COW05_09600 [Gammaproteobacteria bacterium CG12_big_fil_rev_8_21_14_0_65_46_12]PIR10101.1 MAG: hypothetical protein COV52_10375 [Gammaproteobacteria bacterium CG11_big_fil_rev_8_21_14_0_20_46_22]
MIQFNTIAPPNSPNFCLVYSAKQKPGDRIIQPPVYDRNIHDVEKQWLAYISKQPRIKRLSVDKHQHHYRFEQRSAVFHFPDIIDIQFVSLGQKKTTVYFYSRSVYGYYDFGVNCKRLKRWLIEKPSS